MSKSSEPKIYEKNPNLSALAIDSHAHLDRLDDAQEIVESMASSGLKKIVLMAGNKKTALWASEMATKHQNIYYMFGLHPYDIDEFTPEFVELITRLKKTDKKLVGLGEIGLDYKPSDWMKPELDQQQVFLEQLKLAHSLGLPVSLHIREAHKDAIKLLTQNKHLLTNSGIIHCCSATVEEVKTYLSLGFYISFSGSITYGKKNAPYYLEETLKAVPLDKLMIETDCPFLCPAPYRGQTNSPKFVLVVAEKIAEILGMDANELINITTSNTERLLKI